MNKSSQMKGVRLLNGLSQFKQLTNKAIRVIYFYQKL